jgi:hypothetical protein
VLEKGRIFSLKLKYKKQNLKKNVSLKSAIANDNEIVVPEFLSNLKILIVEDNKIHFGKKH